MPLAFTPVKSSNLKEVAKLGDDLIVSFNNGKRFRYVGAGSLFDDLIGSPSAGKFFIAKIKPQFQAAPFTEEEEG